MFMLCYPQNQGFKIKPIEDVFFIRKGKFVIEFSSMIRFEFCTEQATDRTSNYINIL
jgi:hypothetical protein